MLDRRTAGGRSWPTRFSRAIGTAVRPALVCWCRNQHVAGRFQSWLLSQRGNSILLRRIPDPRRSRALCLVAVFARVNSALHSTTHHRSGLLDDVVRRQHRTVGGHPRPTSLDSAPAGVL